MKLLINCTVVVYLGKLRSSLLKGTNAATTEAVRREAEFLLNSLDYVEVLSEVEILKPEKVLENDKYLSETDLELAFLAARQNYILVTDDKKLRAKTTSLGAKAIDLQHLIEFLHYREKLSKNEAIKLLYQLEKEYNRKKDVRKAIERINKR